jgi:hypothetical protein
LVFLFYTCLVWHGFSWLLLKKKRICTYLLETVIVRK